MIQFYEVVENAWFPITFDITKKLVGLKEANWDRGQKLDNLEWGADIFSYHLIA